MNNVIDFGKWLARNFFFITIGIFIIIYLRWFRLTPLVFGYYNDPNDAYIAGLILLSIYSFLVIIFNVVKRKGCIKSFIFIFTTIFFVLNIAFLYGFSPSMITTTYCNEITYYISSGSPLTDPQWTYYQFTKWKNDFSYKSFFFGYSGWDYKIICDEEKREANVIIPFLDALDYTDGENPRSYLHTSTKLNNHLYVMSVDWYTSEGCDRNRYWYCDTFTYTLYQCNLNYTSCNSIPIQYSTKFESFFYLESDEIKQEINLYDNDDDALIFTWGNRPRCYIEGCEILEETK